MSGIHINPAHKGRFTKLVTGKKNGKLTNAEIEKALHSKSAKVRAEANFARMARRHFKAL